MNDIIKNSIPLLPHRSGVYLMYDDKQTIIYIGKAKDLYKRVSQYFLRPQSGKVFAMVNKVHHFDYVITKNEKEAFILEMNLIQTHYPRYNILLKDDKHYPYIALKKKNDPYLKIARHSSDPNYYYFGPYPSSRYAYEIINLLNFIFPLRKCRNIPATPCLYYHLNQCLAPCINKIKEADFAHISLQIRDFLSGNNADVVKDIKEKMLWASEEMQYEKAKEYKDILDAIKHINDSQNVESKNRISRDVFAYSSRDGYLALSLLTYRNGLLLGKDSFVLEEFGQIDEQISELIMQYYQRHELPKEIVVRSNEVKDNLEQFYDSKIISPVQGQLFEICEIARLNAVQTLDNYFSNSSLNSTNDALLEELAKILSIPTPYRIELFDNSHLMGDAEVGAMVVFINGEPAKKMYRRFHINGNEKGDDYASMKEIVYRRYHRLKENNESMPNLILVDGGDKQVRAAKAALEIIKIDLPIFGLFKNDKHQTSGLIDASGKIFPIENQQLFFMLVRMQDEVHRYAIAFHHELRNKNYKLSIYDGIKGLGKKRIQLLENTYQTLDKMKNASIEELKQILPNDVALELYNRLKAIN